jgi:hypothetical protein
MLSQFVPVGVGGSHNVGFTYVRLLLRHDGVFRVNCDFKNVAL